MTQVQGQQDLAENQGSSQECGAGHPPLYGNSNILFAAAVQALNAAGRYGNGNSLCLIVDISGGKRRCFAQLYLAGVEISDPADSRSHLYAGLEEADGLKRSLAKVRDRHALALWDGRSLLQQEPNLGTRPDSETLGTAC